MKKFTKRRKLLLCVAIGIAGFGQSLSGSCAEVTAHLHIEHTGKQKSADHAVVWLTPLSGEAREIPAARRVSQYRLVQHNREFVPHLLVVPVGASVDFPNLDPFYHNVFSLFNGTRFDLGLYESGSHRTVHFDHEGISFIFCNIHPDMGAVVIALPTPYFGIAAADGGVTIHDVPPGAYQLSIWAEGADPAQLNELGRRVQLSSGQENLGTFSIRAVTQGTPHKNKFGDDYGPDDIHPY